MPDYMIGDVKVTPDTGQVLRAGKSVHLEPKSMAVLLHLIDHAGEVVARETLLDAAWPGIHVGDDSLTAAIIKIRRALGDDARNPTHLETIPKRGYRLVSDIRPAEVRQTGISPRTGRHGPFGVLVAVALGLVLVLVAGAWLRPAPDDVVRAAPEPGGKVMIAVAPFENLGQDPGQDYLAQGIGDSLLTGLAQVPEFSVRRALSVGSGARPSAYVLEGSVLRAADVVRINARLTTSEHGEVLLAMQFDRPFSDLLTIEDEIRDTILDKLKVSIGKAERARRARGYTDNVVAYDLFLRARAKLLVRTEGANLAARSLYRQAIAKDADFARAYGGLALTYAAEYRNGWAEDTTRALENAEKYARTAIALSPNLPEQHWVIGYVRTQERSYARRATSCRRRSISIRNSPMPSLCPVGSRHTAETPKPLCRFCVRRCVSTRTRATSISFCLRAPITFSEISNRPKSIWTRRFRGIRKTLRHIFIWRQHS
jgi:DNA-binding winged helix-turn-helix (wHTH) protein/TolB-like protein